MGRRKTTVPELPIVFSGGQAVLEGAVTRATLQQCQRVLRGVYTPPGVRLTHEVKCRAAGLVLDDGAQITGRSAATIRGVPLARYEDPVEVVVPDQSQQERYGGILFRHVTAPLDGGAVWEGCHLASPSRMAFDLAARNPLPQRRLP